MSDCSTNAFKAKRGYMTLDEAIDFLTDQLADPTHDYGCNECRDEHVQLRCWLVELRSARKLYVTLGSIAREMLRSMRKISKEIVRIRLGRNSYASCLGVLAKNISDACDRYADRIEELGVIVDE